MKEKEDKADTVEAVREWFRALSDGKMTAKTTRRFVFRGHPNSDWTLTSTLSRFLERHHETPSEANMRAMEKAIMVIAHRRGLHQVGGARLSYMNQLAHLQHYGAPTRLIDVSFDPNVALWFATAPESEEIDQTDGRVFAFAVQAGDGSRMLSEQENSTLFGRDAADSNDCPWSNPTNDWSERWWCWQPPLFERRMFAQNGAFLVGGVPKKGKGNSLAMEWHGSTIDKIKPKKPRLGKGVLFPTYSLVIGAKAKAAIQEVLLSLYGIDQARLFPDFSGVANYLAHQSSSQATGIPRDVKKLYDKYLENLNDADTRKGLKKQTALKTSA